MTRLQFRVLYREFLFRMVDLEVLSAYAQGDMSKLLGQFAALLIFLSLLFSLGAIGFGGKLTGDALLGARWGVEHILIATTMLVVGLFAVLSWDSTFPDRRDVLVLAPLPVRARTLFIAKVAAVASALSLTVVSLHCCSGLLWPLSLVPESAGIFGFVRSYFAYWITMLAAGSFIFCCVLGVQGVAAQLLPRRIFLRVSSFLQMAAFCLFICVYFLQPWLANPKEMAATQNQQALAWLPSYWFLGLFQDLNGSMHPALAPLARRAWIGLIVTVSGAGIAFLLSYFRTLRKIIEEPDITPGLRGATWLPRFGNSLHTAVVHFSIRTLLRSRQHRVILAFYVGVGFAMLVGFLGTPLVRKQLLAVSSPWRQLNVPLLVATVTMMCFWVVGTRVVFAMPRELRANWVFRITPVRGAPDCLPASRRALWVLGIAPAWAGSALLLFWLCPWRPVAGHLVVLALLGMIVAEQSLHGFLKIPFSCSYLPGKSNFHLTFWLCIGYLFMLVTKGAEFERSALQNPRSFVPLLAGLTVLLAGLWWRASALAKSPESELQFEEVAPAEIFSLGLYRDGILPMEPPQHPPS